MPSADSTAPIKDSVAKVDGEIAVGSDLGFQRNWWRFSNGMWIVFSLVIVADLLGCFGRGPLAKAHLRSPDGVLDLKYERIERFSTPSILQVDFAPSAIHDGKVQLWISDDLLKRLGNQRVMPQPANSQLENGGILYTFAATTTPATAAFALEPTSPGIFSITLQVPGHASLRPNIYVMP